MTNKNNIFRIKDKIIIKIGNSLNDVNKEKFSVIAGESLGYIGSKNIDLSTSKIKNVEFNIPLKYKNTFNMAKKGSVLLCIEGGSAGRKISRLDKNYYYVNKLANFSSKIINNSYIYYYLQSSFFLSQFKRDLSGMIGGVSINNLKLMKCINKTNKEQKLIVNYLDEKTSSIDNSIEILKLQKERLIEQKKAIIHKAVTKGLENNIKHWKLFRLKDKININTGNSLNQKQKEIYSLNDNNSYIYVGSKNIDLISSKIKNIDFFIPRKKASNFKIAEKGTSLLCIEGGSAGKKITKLDKNCCFVNKLANFNSKKVNNSFIYYYLQSSYFKSQFKRDLTGMIGGVSINNLKLMTSILPSEKEQEKIVEYLDIKTSKINEAVNEVEKQISLLEEYKKTLINDVVTGKIKVF